jgi:hypothetical protein
MYVSLHNHKPSMFLSFHRFAAKVVIISSVFFGIYSFHQRSQAAADINAGNYPINGISSALLNKYLIAQIGILNRPFAHSKTFNTNVIEQMYRGKMVDGKWQSSDSVPGGLAGAMRRQLSKGVLVGGVDHLEKAQGRLASLKLILKTKKIGDGTQNGEALDAYDLKIAMDLHDDLQDALQTKKSN